MAEIWVARSTDGGQTFEDFPVSDIAFSVGPLPGFGGNYNGDYIGIAASGGRVYPVWNAQVPDANSQAWTSPFTDISVTLLWPNALGITVEEADTYAIRYNGDAAAGIKNVEALFSYDGGQTWPDAIGPHPYDPPYPSHVENHTIDWPVTQAPTYTGRVRVVLYDSLNQTVEDTSDYDITVMLARPGNVQVQTTSPWTSVTLTWEDRSQYNTGYEIQRINEDGDTATFSVGDVTSYEDRSVRPFHTYRYRIRAVDDNGHTSAWVEQVVFNTPHWTVQGPLKWIRTTWAGDWLYVFYAYPINPGSPKAQIFYRYSTDGGWSFSDEYSVNTPVGIYPYRFEVAGERTGHRVGVLYSITNIGHGGDVRFFVKVVEGASSGNELSIPVAYGGHGYGGLLWKPGTDTLLVALEKNATVTYTYPFWVIDVAENTVDHLGIEDMQMEHPLDVVLQDRMLWTPQGPALGLSDADQWDPGLHGVFHIPEPGTLGIYLLYEPTGAVSDLSASRTLLAFREGNQAKVLWYFTEDSLIAWTTPQEAYTYTEPDTFPVDLEVAKWGVEEYMLVRDGARILLRHRNTLGQNRTWQTRTHLNLLEPLGLMDLDLHVPILVSPGSYTVKIASAYGLDQNAPLLVFKKRTYRPLIPIVADPRVEEWPGDGQRRMVHEGDRTFLVWSQEGTLWYAWTDQKAEEWTTAQYLGIGRAPAITEHPDGTGFDVFFWKGLPGEDTLMVVSHTSEGGFGTPQAVWVPDGGVAGPVAGAASEEGIFLAFQEALGSPVGQGAWTVNSQALQVLTLDRSNYQVIQQETLAVDVKSRADTLQAWSLWSHLRAPSVTCYADYVAVLERSADSSEVTLYEHIRDHWRRQVVAQGEGPYRSPHAAMEGKTVYLFWSQGTPGEIFYRYRYAGDTTFISKPMNLSNTPREPSTEPWYAGQRVFWSEERDNGRDVVQVSLALSSKPEPVDPQDWGDAARPQVAFYTVGGQYYESSVYVVGWLEKEQGTGETVLLTSTYSTGPVPEQVITLGDTIPNPTTVNREGIEVYGEEKGKSADVGAALTYKIKDLDPARDYRLGFYIYHEKDTTVRERFYADGRLLKVSEAEPGEITYVEVVLPRTVYTDSVIVLEVTKESGPTAILNEIYVFGERRPEGGPMASESQAALPRSFGIQWVRPLPLKGTGQVQLAIPRVARVTLDLYDITGRRVRRFFQGTLAPGYHVLNLSPQDDQGHRLASGVYFLRLETPEAVRTRKVLWLR